MSINNNNNNNNNNNYYYNHNNYNHNNNIIIGHLPHSRVNFTHLDGVSLAVFLLFAKQLNVILTFSHKQLFKHFLSSNFVLDTIKLVIEPRVVQFRELYRVQT